MLKQLQDLRDNYELAREFNLPLSADSVQNAEYLFGLEYDEFMDGFWEDSWFKTIKLALDDTVSRYSKLESELNEAETYLDVQEIKELLKEVEPEDLFNTVLRLALSKMKDEVGKIGPSLSDDVWTELVQKMGIEVTPQIHAKRNHYKKLSDFVGFCESNELNANSEVPVEFQAYFDEVKKYAEFLKLLFVEKQLLSVYISVFKLISVDKVKISEMISDISNNINTLIEDFESQSVQQAVEPTEELLDYTEESNELELIEELSEDSEPEVWTDDELYQEYVALEFDGAMVNLRTFLNNPEYIVSLLRMFGSFKYNVEKDFTDFEARLEVIRIFLEKTLTQGESSNWSNLARRSFREAIIESFEGYELATGSTINLLDQLNFESDSEAEYVYHPSAIVVIDNKQLYIRDLRRIVNFMDGKIDGNGGSKHPEFVIEFDEFKWTQGVSNRFFKGDSSRHAKILMNELTSFMSRHGIESLTKNDFERLQAAYDSIGIRIEFRP